MMQNPVLPRNLFITLEGIEGVGKSTACQIIKNCLQRHKIDVTVTREPGGTEIAEAIRQVLLQHYQETMQPDTELLLMFAARAQHLATVIKPALAAQRWVLCDRFTDASYAYQGGGRGIAIERIEAMEEWVQGSLRPDLTFLFDAPVSLALTRVKRRNKKPDRVEAEKKLFFERVRAAYLARAKKEPQRYRIIDASKPLVMVRQQLQQYCEQLLNPTAT